MLVKLFNQCNFHARFFSRLTQTVTNLPATNRQSMARLMTSINVVRSPFLFHISTNISVSLSSEETYIIYFVKCCTNEELF